MIKKMTGIVLMIILAIGFSGKVSQAVVPDSTTLDAGEQPEPQKLADILQKIEHHEEEDIYFLKYLKQQIKDLKKID